MSDCGRNTPVEQFVGRLGKASLPDWLLVHLNELSGSDFDLMTRSTKKLSIVHCPRSHDYFGHSPFQFHKLRDLGCNVCLGTDSLASNDDLNLFAEMRAFQKNFPDVSPEEILRMVTVNGSRAMRHEKSLGQIRAGSSADLISVPVASSISALEEIVAFDREVSWSMIGGRVQNSA
jgi:cytosine/adenosine deaminase-related metal-dependent hydrolase